VGGRTRAWCRAAGQEVGGVGAGIDAAADPVPDLRELLPLVEEDGGGAVQVLAGASGDRGRHRRVVEADDPANPALCRLGLAHSPRAVNGDGAGRGEDVIKDVVQRPTKIGHGTSLR